MIAQYLAIKEAHKGYILFYRMGDFYELFFEDAVIAAEALDITLTKRGKYDGKDIPMCGVPVHAHENYLARLIKKGFKVAVGEQLENPAEAKKRGYKAIVKRDVVRIITSGTLTEDTLLDARKHNYLTAVSEIKGKAALAWVDVSTGDFFVQKIDNLELSLSAMLARIEPKELLISDKLLQNTKLFETLGEWKTILSPMPSARFNST
ncbi:MAG: DNA mismatch repair protein MutS, partial [Alphaproteobacteria bacterium]|nr:DNA mismatch repair protein MutS [Alphaproteobacteria bacterium]